MLVSNDRIGDALGKAFDDGLASIEQAATRLRAVSHRLTDGPPGIIMKLIKKRDEFGPLGPVDPKRLGSDQSGLTVQPVMPLVIQ